MGQWHYEGESIVGRIGYESSAKTELWDDTTNDFYDSLRPLGLTSPFALDPARLRIAFQLRGREIKSKSFTAAFQALLNEASPVERWRVHRELVQVPFNEWVSSVQRIVLVRVHLERPNPHYKGRGRVESIIEGTNARLVDLKVTADLEDPQGIDIDDDLIREAIDHAGEYGNYTAVAERDGERTSW